ncbi:hypothetical protein AUR64_01620 [Haloprofundus marisrubri]|uniref:Uncharacterized protein n=1 Tax=Haloprofundus marisrubri TaxID=1514971 RepID=A0A0W1R412_9EURY|nr:hypothetical protein AUR64_01620 [Haloprofundus marisrubri]
MRNAGVPNPHHSSRANELSQAMQSRCAAFDEAPLASYPPHPQKTIRRALSLVGAVFSQKNRSRSDDRLDS